MNAKQLLRRTKLSVLLDELRRRSPKPGTLLAIAATTPIAASQLGVKKKASYEGTSVYHHELRPGMRKKRKGDKGISDNMHRFIGPTLAAAVTGAGLGAATSPKGTRLAAGKKGAVLGAINAALWRALTRGYHKATGVDAGV